MGRSNTGPTTEPPDSQPSKTPIARSATTSAQSATSGTDRKSKSIFSSHKQDGPDPAITTNATLPDAPVRLNSFKTRYMDMLLAMDQIPRVYNILSSFCTWILLAGFIIFPGTFTSIQGLNNDAAVAANHTASTIIASIKNIPLLVVAGVCSGVGAAGMAWLWWRWRQNYVWLLNKIFLYAFCYIYIPRPFHHEPC
jgi:hypothetical protein